MFKITDADGEDKSGMIPIGDLFKHTNPNRSAVEWDWGKVPRGKDEPDYVEEEKEGIVFKATKDIKPGMQATGTYGTKTDFQLLT